MIQTSKIFNESKGQHIWLAETICEVHRQMYDLMVIHLRLQNPELFNQLLPLLEKAYMYGIKITKKLIDYKCMLPHSEKILSVDEVIKLRQLRIKLDAEIETFKMGINMVGKSNG